MRSGRRVSEYHTECEVNGDDVDMIVLVCRVTPLSQPSGAGGEDNEVRTHFHPIYPLLRIPTRERRLMLMNTTKYLVLLSIMMVLMLLPR